jgi:hypothetical protein
MKDIITYGITEANNRGISGVVKDSEENGLVMLKRNKIPVAMIVPLTVPGYVKYIQLLEKLMDIDMVNKNVPDDFFSISHILRGLLSLQKEYLAKKQIEIFTGEQ